jgi:hypothetical protein
LLREEGVEVIDGRVDMQVYEWRPHPNPSACYAGYFLSDTSSSGAEGLSSYDSSS